jgi:hypothetical protein
MKELKDVVALVHDHGLFLVPLAQKLAESCKHVYVTSPWETGFSTLNAAILGDGYDNIDRVDDLWAVKGEVDLFCFPDIQHAGLQLELESQGKAVWGARRGDRQELLRELFLKTLADLGLEVPPHAVRVGLTELGKYLKEKEDCFIKISKYRGSLETTHWRSWALDKELLALWAVRFGPAGEHIRFLVFDKIDTPLEIGGDTYCVDGRWPGQMLHGIEWKDESYFAAVTEREAMPEQIQEVMAAFGPVLGRERYRNQFSMEIRVKDDVGYFIDPTCRGGLPSTGSQLEVWKNFAEIVWAGANGELVEPEAAAKFAAECILTMKGDKTMWGVTDIPPALRRWMKLSNVCEIDGHACFPPDESQGHAIGWLVATGDTPQETIARMNAQADELPDGINANTECLAYVLKEIHEEEAAGIQFTEQTVPEPAAALDD